MRIFVIILFILQTYSFVFSQNADSLFLEANEHYQEGEYEEAIDLYLKIDSLGFESSNLFFNTGNAFFRSNKLGKARLYYERALEMKPSDDDIRTNLNYTESFLTDRFEEVPVLFFIKWYQDLGSVFSSNEWAMISIILFVLSLAGFIMYVLIRLISLRKTGFYIGITLLFLSIFAFSFAFQQSREPDAAIVVTGSINVKSAPRNSGKDLFILHEGSKVWLLDELEGWKEVRIVDGRKGWISDIGIEKI